MTKDYIINHDCFSDEDRRDYYIYKDIIGDRLSDIAGEYMNRVLSLGEALDVVHTFESENIGRYTLDLLFVLECAPILEKIYEERGMNGKMFREFLEDIKHKTDECRRVKKVFGTFVIEWFDGFFKCTRICFGRLQFDIAKCDQDSGIFEGFTIEDGDFISSCHIPSGSPLKQELWMDSFKMAYNFFSDRLKGGIMPVVCSSWLLYPGYADVFGENSNVMNFVRNFEITKTTKDNVFEDAWRIFGMDFDGDFSKLPADTTMQRKFIEYMRSGKPFGSSRGILVFDGSKILTRR